MFNISNQDRQWVEAVWEKIAFKMDTVIKKTGDKIPYTTVNGVYDDKFSDREKVLAKNMMERSAKSCMLFGAMPAFYYLFDFAATVYTDFLYSGARTAVQLMPFVISTFYFVFVLLYYSETQKHASIQRERDILDTQLRQAQTEFASLRQMQQNAAAYRHDMRHHFALLQRLAIEGHVDEIKEYLKTAQSDIDAITPLRFCENETINLILSSFATKAQ